MTSATDTTTEHDRPLPPQAAAVEDRFASPVPVANAALVGLPLFIVGSIALGLVLTGFANQALAGAPIAIIAAATGLGLVTAMVFALKAGESAVASVFGIFAGFWISYAVLVLGILHNWFGFIAAPTQTGVAAQAQAAALTGQNILDAQKVFLLSWLILVVLLVLASLRLPVAFTVLFVLVALALLFVYLGTVNASSAQLKTGGYIVFAFCVVGAYLFVDAMGAATGAKNLPLGKAILS